MANDDHALTVSEFLLYQTEDGLARPPRDHRAQSETSNPRSTSDGVTAP